VAITWRADSLGRTAEVATDECSAISPPMPARHTHQSLGLFLGANVFHGSADNGTLYRTRSNSLPNKESGNP
jgi:hypothetical protein